MEPCPAESKLEAYQYVPLPSPTHLRRCIIQPDHYEKPITITIDAVEFSTASPDYEALSYVWESEEDPLQVTVDCGNGERRALSVTQNLHGALRHLRRPDSTRLMWVDAICINQKDDVEKGPQVGMMDQIYTRATRVVAWLGPEADKSDRAMWLMGSLGSQIRIDLDYWDLKPVADSVVHDLVDLAKPLDISKDEFRLLTALLRRPWFTRLWIRQEIFLANEHAIICCGESQVPWSKFRNALALLYRKSVRVESIGPEPSAFMSSIRQMRGIILQLRQVRLDDLRTSFDSAHCEDKRDRVFAVKGMLEDWSSMELTPDYTKTYEDVYTDAVERSVAHFDSLNIIGQCELLNEDAATRTRLPSWVPDWSQKSTLERFDLETLASSYLAPRYQILKGGQQQQVLRVFGMVTTVVQTTGPIVGPRRDDTLQEDISMLYTAVSKLDDATRTAHSRDTNLVQQFALALQAGFRADRYHPPRMHWPSAHDYAEVVRHILMRTLTEDRVVVSPGLSTAIRGYCENLVGRRLGWDAGGVPILCPGSAAPGDQVSVLVGCRYPMLLRSLPATGGGRSHQRYAVVGQCVTMDTCDGDAMLGPLPEGIRIARIMAAQRQYGFVTQGTGEVSFLDPRLAEEDLLEVDVESAKRWMRDHPGSPVSVSPDRLKVVVKERTGREMRWLDLV